MASSSKFVSIAQAHDQTQAIQIRLILDRTRIPYQIKGELLHSLWLAGTSALGPMEFLVPTELKEEAEAALQEIFDLRPEDIPETCPACGAKTEPGKLECPSCGLFLA